MRSLTLDSSTDGELGVRPSRLLGPRVWLSPETEVVAWPKCAVNCPSPLCRTCSRRRRVPLAGPKSCGSVADDDDREYFFELSRPRCCCCSDPCWSRSSSVGVEGMWGSVWRRSTGRRAGLLRSWLDIPTTSKDALQCSWRHHGRLTTDTTQLSKDVLSRFIDLPAFIVFFLFLCLRIFSLLLSQS